MYEGGSAIGAAIREFNTLVYLVIAGLIFLVIGLSILYRSIRMDRQQHNSERVSTDELE